MKKCLNFGILLVLFAVAFYACSGNHSNSKSPEELKERVALAKKMSKQCGRTIAVIDVLYPDEGVLIQGHLNEAKELFHQAMYHPQDSTLEQAFSMVRYCELERWTFCPDVMIECDPLPLDTTLPNSNDLFIEKACVLLQEHYGPSEATADARKSLSLLMWSWVGEDEF